MEFSYATFISLFLLIVIVSFHQFYVTLMCLFLLIVIQSFHLLFVKNKSNRQSGTLPPGKTGWPIIGETLEFHSNGLKGHPEKFILDRMNKYSSNIIKTHLIGEKAVIFCGAAANKFLFSNENKLVELWLPSIIDKIFPSATQTPSKDESMQLRNIMLQTFFKPGALQRSIGTMDEIAEGHFVSCWENRDEVVVHTLANRFTFELACKLFASIEDPNLVAKFEDAFNQISPGLSSVPIDFPGTRFRRAIKATAFIREEFVSIIKQRKIDLGDGKASPTQDILSQMLLRFDENGKFMNEMDIAGKILGLIVASQSTTTSLCTFIVKYLAELPEIYQGVYKEQMEIANSKAVGELLNWNDVGKMKYSWNVACEVLRLSPPVQGAFREGLTDFMFNGFSIPKGWKIYWNVASTHNNPEYFDEPQKFDPSRFMGAGPAPYTFVPFGGGPRMCPGNEYARLTILVFTHHLVTRFKLEKINLDEKILTIPIRIPANGLPIRLYSHEKFKPIKP